MVMICSAIKCNILLTLFFIFGVSVVLAAQTKPAPQVISSGGKHMENDKAKIDSTSGEIIVETKGVNTRPTQGFQQPRLQLMTPVMQLSFEGKIKVFPNPVKTSLTVVIEAQGKF